MADVVTLNPSKPSAVKELYAIGEIPPLGVVPPKMHAWAIRKDRHGPPMTSMQLEVLPTWPIGEDEVLVYVMAAGVNYNGVWAAAGLPVSIFRYTGYDFHIAGSDASGIVDQGNSQLSGGKVGLTFKSSNSIRARFVMTWYFKRPRLSSTRFTIS